MILIEPHYLPNLEFFTAISSADEIFFDIESRFIKQTFRNRTTILGANGPKNLIVPVHFKNHSALKDVTIDYQQPWIRNHWGGFYSSYGKSAFFEHFAALFKKEWNSKYKYLIDLNHAMLAVCFKILNWSPRITTKPPKSDFIDLRDNINSKISYKNRELYVEKPYFQNFGNTFVPNLSIVDLVLNLGSEASKIIYQSVKPNANI